MTLWILRSENCSWTWAYRRKHNKLIVSWKHLPLDIQSAILISSYLKVCQPVKCRRESFLIFFIDHPYILAFSLIMLHTDAFNKSNKRKMTKADYIKNTKLVGVSTEVLDVRVTCLFLLSPLKLLSSISLITLSSLPLSL